MSSILFEARTHAAHAIKILIDTLNYYLNKKGSFVIKKEGIFLNNTTANDDVYCDLKLLAENFQEYNFYAPKEICFTINLTTFYNEMLKKIRKKDSITIQILSENQKLFLKVTKEAPDNKGNTSSAKTVVIESRQLPISAPGPYGQPITVLAKTFQQSCREITRPTNKEIEITCWNGRTLQFFASKDGAVENEATFGAMKEESKVPPEITFKSKCFAANIIRPAKLAGLNETIKIFVMKDLPLYYKMNVGSLGEIGIYIKTIEQIQSEKDTIYNEDEYDDEK